LTGLDWPGSDLRSGTSTDPPRMKDERTLVNARRSTFTLRNASLCPGPGNMLATLSCRYAISGLRKSGGHRRSGPDCRCRPGPAATHIRSHDTKARLRLPEHLSLFLSVNLVTQCPFDLRGQARLSCRFLGTEELRWKVFLYDVIALLHVKRREVSPRGGKARRVS
jgi:hypothetical protein